jgi:hypothetical protein
MPDLAMILTATPTSTKETIVSATYSYDNEKAEMTIEYTSYGVTGTIRWPTYLAMRLADEHPSCEGGRRHWSAEGWATWAQDTGAVAVNVRDPYTHVCWG